MDMSNNENPHNKTEMIEHSTSVVESNPNTIHEIVPTNPPTIAIQPPSSNIILKINEDDKTLEKDDINVKKHGGKNSCSDKLKKIIFHFLPSILCHMIIYISQLPIIIFIIIVPVAFAAVLFVLIISGCVIAFTATISLLLVSLIVIRLLQVLKHGQAYSNVVQLKFFIRFGLLFCMGGFVTILALLYPIFKYAPGFKNTMVLGLNLTNWVPICFIIFWIQNLSLVASVLTFFFLPLVPLDRLESGLIFPETVIEIMNYLIFWLAESQIGKRVPTFKQHQILGLRTQKWIKLSIFIFVAYNAIVLVTYMIVYLTKLSVCCFDLKIVESQKYLSLIREHLVYWVNGIKRSFDFILSTVLLLLIWVYYFGNHLDKTTKAQKVLDFGFWTCLSLFIFSILWLVKTCVLLSWEATSMYTRLKPKILDGGKILYLLAIIGRHKHDLFNHDIVLVDIKRNRPVEHELFPLLEDRTHTLYDLQQAAGYFLTARNILLKEKYVGDILEDLKSECHNDNGRIKSYLKECIEGKKTHNKNEETQNSSNTIEVVKKKDTWAFIKDLFKRFFSVLKDLFKRFFSVLGTFPSLYSNKWGTTQKDNQDYFEKLFDEYMDPPNEVSFEKLQSWMVMARENSLFLANTLSTAKEVVDCLNRIISSLLFVAIFIMWLLLTGLATTKLLVIIASPLLAATFMFGDTCKTLFQGIMFAYIIHPFDVGDLCVIDENLMEVKTVGVWQTTFSEVGKQDTVMYPNSDLSTKKIINYKTEFNWNDSVEVSVASLNEEKVAILKQEIEKYLNDEKKQYLPSYSCVEVLTGETLKISVRIRYNVNAENISHFECFKKKLKQRSNFILKVQGFVDEKKNVESKTSEKKEGSADKTMESIGSKINSHNRGGGGKSET